MASMEPTPDLRFYLAIHAKLRADIARYVRAVERATEDERARRVALRRWATGFVGELLEHHHAEDEHLFPDLRARVPARGRSSTASTATTAHGRAARPLDRRGAGTDRSGPSLRGRPPRAAGGVRRAARPPRCAPAVEDADVLPLFVRHYSAAEFDAVQAAAGATPASRA